MLSVDFAALPDEQLRALLVEIRSELRGRRNSNRTCLICQDAFSGRIDAQYCSARCRTAAHRLKTQAAIPSNVKQVDILGLGYEGKSVDELIELLLKGGVTTLVDVRLNAISRKRGFSKTALREALAASGISYLHFRALGNHRDNREGYGAIGTAAAHAARDRFRETLQAPATAAAIEEIRKLADEQTIAVFCYEHATEHCHREQVIEAISAQNSPGLALDCVTVAAGG